MRRFFMRRRGPATRLLSSQFRRQTRAVCSLSVCLLSTMVPMVVGTGSSALAADPPLQQQEATAEKVVPVFKDGEAQVVEAFRDSNNWIRHDLFVETDFDSDNDGQPDRMHVDVTRPKQTDTEGLKLPVVYETSPYYSGVSSTSAEFMWDPKHELGVEPPERPNPPEIEHQSRRPVISNSQVRTWVPRGYIVVHSCSPGTGLSQGCPTVGGENEELAPKAVIEWLCGRRKGYTSLDGDEEVKAFWCNGKVGMTGTSYNGTLPLAAATTGVEGLEAIIPVAPNTSYYHYYRSNGLVRHPGGYMGEDIDVLYDFIHSGDPDNREGCNCEIRDKLYAENQDRLTGDLNDFWIGRDYRRRLGKVKAAVLMAHGLNDWNVMPSHTINVHEKLKENDIPLQIYLHQGGHGGPPTLKMMNRWFTHYLHGIDNGVQDDARAWVVREEDKMSDPTAYDAYPNPAAVPVTLHLTPGGKSSGQLQLEAARAVGSESFTDNVEFSGSKLAAAPESEHRLIYASQELKAPLHLSGWSKLKIRVACNKPAANLSVWLVSLPWDDNGKINADIITRGWADPQNSKSESESTPLVPGEFVDLEFELEPDDQIIPAGQKIGLMIFSSDRDFTLWPEAGTELTVDLAGTELTLPVVGGTDAWKAAQTAEE